MRKKPPHHLVLTFNPPLQSFKAHTQMQKWNHRIDNCNHNVQHASMFGDWRTKKIHYTWAPLVCMVTKNRPKTRLVTKCLIFLSLNWAIENFQLLTFGHHSWWLRIFSHQLLVTTICDWSFSKKFNHLSKKSGHPVDQGLISTIDLMIEIF